MARSHALCPPTWTSSARNQQPNPGRRGERRRSISPGERQLAPENQVMQAPGVKSSEPRSTPRAGRAWARRFLPVGVVTKLQDDPSQRQVRPAGHTEADRTQGSGGLASDSSNAEESSRLGASVHPCPLHCSARLEADATSRDVRCQGVVVDCRVNELGAKGGRSQPADVPVDPVGHGS